MGQANNNPGVSGDEKMATLQKVGRLSEQYKGKKYDELRAVDQFEIDLAFDKAQKDALEGKNDADKEVEQSPDPVQEPSEETSEPDSE